MTIRRKSSRSNTDGDLSDNATGVPPLTIPWPLAAQDRCTSVEQESNMACQMGLNVGLEHAWHDC